MEMETYAFDGDNAEVPTALVRAGAGTSLLLTPVSRLRVIEMHLTAEHALNTVVHGACTIHSFPGELE
jgi:hypothetical protein